MGRKDKFMGKKDILIEQLIRIGIYKEETGRHLYELSLQELEELWRRFCCKVLHHPKNIELKYSL